MSEPLDQHIRLRAIDHARKVIEGGLANGRDAGTIAVGVVCSLTEALLLRGWDEWAQAMHRRYDRDTSDLLEQATRVDHVRGNAEDCPACAGANPPYPFTCPGPDQGEVPRD